MIGTSKIKQGFLKVSKLKKMFLLSLVAGTFVFLPTLVLLFLPSAVLTAARGKDSSRGFVKFISNGEAASSHVTPTSKILKTWLENPQSIGSNLSFFNREKFVVLFYTAKGKKKMLFIPKRKEEKKTLSFIKPQSLSNTCEKRA